jgi:hypothetical protein
VLLAAAVHFTAELERFVSTRRIEAAWKQARQSGVDRAQPGSPGHADAHAIENYVFQRIEQKISASEIEGRSLEQLAILRTLAEINRTYPH